LAIVLHLPDCSARVRPIFHEFQTPLQTRLGDERAKPNTMEDVPEAKVLIIGDSGVGKTSILIRAAENTFDDSPGPRTINEDYKSKVVEVPNVVDARLAFRICDTGGLEKFRTITHSSYAGSDCVIIAFDLTNTESWVNVQKWNCECDRYAEEKTVRFLVGNKSDLQDFGQRKVFDDEIKELCEQLDLPFLLVSAKDAVNIENLFRQIATKVWEKNDYEVRHDTLPGPSGGDKTTSKCCSIL
jgi:small GTP-binding protein